MSLTKEMAGTYLHRHMTQQKPRTAIYQPPIIIIH